MNRRWINVSVIAITALLMATSGARAADTPVKTFEATIASADAATAPPEKAFQARVESVDAGTKTVTMQVESIHDISAFMRRGDTVEIVVSE